MVQRFLATVVTLRWSAQFFFECTVFFLVHGSVGLSCDSAADPKQGMDVSRASGRAKKGKREKCKRE